MCVLCTTALVLLESEEDVGFPGIGVIEGPGNQIPFL